MVLQSYNEQKNPYKAFLSGLLGINILIIIHELGHFLAAWFFNVPTPTFSIGFGPALLQIPLKSTIFQIALLPIGGYVEINQEILAQQPYVHKMIIILAGIVFNVLFSLGVVAYYTVKKSTKDSLSAGLAHIYKQKTSGVIGPVGIIYLIGNSFALNKDFFWFILAIMSFNIALFNLLPLPFLDGGKALLLTYQELIK